MKIAILGDAHIGARNDSLTFHAFFAKFYDYFFEYLKEHNITTVIQVGDLWDRRKYVNFQTLSESRKYLFDRMRNENINMITLLGNHDVAFKNTLEVNSSSLLLQEYKNVTIIDKPQTINVNGTDICIIPWICADNYVDSMNELRDTKAELCIGHFEIDGFEMYRGQECHGGLNRDTFRKFDMVFSGHYHHRSTQGNITYLGTPYELTWQDYADPKGFHTFNLVDRELTFIENPYTMFVRIEYDDKDKEPIDPSTLGINDKYVKLVVVNKTDYYKFDLFMNKLYNCGCHDIKVVEDFSEFENGEVDSEVDLEDTLDILSNYIDSLNTEVDKENIKTFMKSLYTEAVNQEVV